MFETKVGSGSPTLAYPLYDTHGNMVATQTKNTGGTSWSIGDERSNDVWGGVRSGAATGGPKGRYVANLGHVQDDESGLIYMRARYYEPESGRFVSEDPAMDGGNWYAYARNMPTIFGDFSGKSPILIAGAFIFGAIAFGIGYILGRSLVMGALKRLAEDSRVAKERDGYSLIQDEFDTLSQLHANEFRELLKGGIGAAILGMIAIDIGITATSIGLTTAIAFVVGFIFGFMATLLESLLYESVVMAGV
ncbi:MAG: RHS repeat-associated core domain-containing protein [Fimbriimonadaceae bacterium]